MNISLHNTGKRFNREWIFRHFNYEFLQGKTYAITGSNGSGKSTLLQIIAGATLHSEGEISWQRAVGNMQLASGNRQWATDNRQEITKKEQQTTNNKQQTTNKRETNNEKRITNNENNETAYQNISIAAPYLDLIEEMTAIEFLQFHTFFKTLTKPFVEILATVGIEKAANKQIRYFSSGMKQRLKLAQAFFSNTTVLLLDEPTTNLDEDGIAIYKKLWVENTANRLVIVSSNDKVEYAECDEVIGIGEYK
jgi:ABC-type multidrug transport system ATPase subunit